MSKKQDAFYFHHLMECAECSVRASKLLAAILHDFDKNKLQNDLHAMHQIQNTADMKKHEIREALVKSFITPIDREDILEVSRNLDDLTDKVEDVLTCIYYHHVTRIRPDATGLVNIVMKCCEEVSAMMKDFANFKHAKTRKDHIMHINALEGEADRLFMNAMYHLHAECHNVMEVIIWRDVYRHLERCTDTAEHVADIVESVIMKNS